MWRAIALVRCGWPIATKCSRAIFHAASTDSEPPLVKKTWLRWPGMRSASASASSIAGGCAVDQLVLNGSACICAAMTEVISSP